MLTYFIRGILEELPASVQSKAILAGGALRAFFDGTEIKDYDLFFRSQRDFIDVSLALSAAGWLGQDAPNGTEAWFAPSGKLFNLVGFAFGEPRDHIDRFDFRCCQMSAWLEGGDVVTPFDMDAHADAVAKRLVVLNNNGTERTLRRIEKYVTEYGYTLALEMVDHLPLADDAGEAEICLVHPKVRPLHRMLRRVPTGGPCGSDGR